MSACSAESLRFFTDETIRGVTQLVVNITLPVLTVYNMQRPFETRVLINFLLTLGLSRRRHSGGDCAGRVPPLPPPAARQARGACRIWQGFSNCGFMGYPIILAVNPDWMIYAVAYNIAYLSLSRGRSA